MRGYLRDWYGVEKQPTMPNDPLGGDMSDMEELEAAAPGEDFDVMVSEMFIEHHLLQIARSIRCLRKAEHDELRSLCAEQIRMQAAEIPVFEKVIADYRDGHGDDGHKSDRHHHRHGHSEHGRAHR